MANYTFLDASASVRTALSDDVGAGVQRPIVNVASIVSWSPIFIAGSVATVSTSVPNQSVSGTVGASIIGAVPVIVSGNPSISGTVGASVIGTVPVVQSGTVITSVVGGYAEDTAHTSGDIGLFALHLRNDTMSSVTSANGDYSAVSVGPVGETIVANAPLTKWVQGTASMLGGLPVTGSLVPIIPAQGASVFTYITGLQVANAAASNVWLTLFGGTNSVIGYTVAPANGGSNIVFPNALKTNANAAFSASISGVSSVYLTAQGFIAGI